MIRVEKIDDPVLSFIPYLNAGRSPSDFKRELIPVYRARVSGMPEGVNAIVVTADLQGLSVEKKKFSEVTLLGEALPTILDPILEEMGITNNIGVLLAGDFYTYPDLKGRGGTGDVTAVWDEMIYHYDWVYGVAGNHDLFGEQISVIPNDLNEIVLDGNIVHQNGLKIGGLSGVIGSPQKNFRRSLNEYCFEIELLLEQKLDILIMHDGPDGGANGYKGDSDVRFLIESLPPTLLIRGHSHWPTPLMELENGTQVLNVDATVVIMTR